MAVLDKNAMKATTKLSDSQDKVNEGEKGRIVNVLEDKSLPTGEVHKIDATEDAWAFNAPPPSGRYTLKVVLAKDGDKCYDDDQDKEPGYGIAMEGKIINSKGGEYDGVVLFPRVATFFGRGKNISTAAGLLVKFGLIIPESANQLQVAQWLVKHLKKEPVIDFELDWRGYSKIEKRNVFRNMEAFPKDTEGNPIHIVQYKTSTGVIEEIKANADVVHWYGKGEESKIKNPGQAGHTGARTTAVGSKAGPMLLTPSDDDLEASTPVVAPTTSNVGVTAEDLSDLEELD